MTELPLPDRMQTTAVWQGSAFIIQAWSPGESPIQVTVFNSVATDEATTPPWIKADHARELARALLAAAEWTQPEEAAP